jgi:hypothetical protein
MTPEALKQRWQFFESKGPEYSTPVKRCCVKEGIPSYVGGLYAALYPKADFRDLIDFNLYQWYSSSVQQSLIATGVPDRDWFLPETAEEGTTRFLAQLPAFEKRKNRRDIRQVFRDLQLPKGVEWVRELDFEEWEVSSGNGALELTAATKQGYLTLFVVDDQ